MNDPYDINSLLASQKGQSLANANVPILGQQMPVFHGLPVNNGIMTLESIQGLPEEQFRELFVAAIVGLMGGVYMPPNAPTEDAQSNDTNNLVTEVDVEKE